jgi:hypothetical protein
MCQQEICSYKDKVHINTPLIAFIYLFIYLRVVYLMMLSVDHIKTEQRRSYTS